MEPSGKCLFSGMSVRAPMTHPFPILAPLRITLPIPTNDPSPALSEQCRRIRAARDKRREEVGRRMRGARAVGCTSCEGCRVEGPRLVR
eukprot:186132-Rhodomonas_salina.4